MIQKDHFDCFVQERRSIGGKSEGRDTAISCVGQGERWKTRVVAMKIVISGWIQDESGGSLLDLLMD